MEKKLFFTIEKVDDNLIDLFFDNPEDTETAYFAVMEYLGDETDGVTLIAMPRFAIVLERLKGAWATWIKHLMPLFVNDEFFATEGRYYLKVIGGHLVPCKSEYLPIALEANSNYLPALT